MPSVLIEVRQAFDREREVRIIDAVHGALIEAFKIPVNDKNVRLLVQKPIDLRARRIACSPSFTRTSALMRSLVAPWMRNASFINAL